MIELIDPIDMEIEVEVVDERPEELTELLDLVHEWLSLVPDRELFSSDDCMNRLLDIQQAAFRLVENSTD